MILSCVETAAITKRWISDKRTLLRKDYNADETEIRASLEPISGEVIIFHFNWSFRPFWLPLGDFPKYRTMSHASTTWSVPLSEERKEASQAPNCLAGHTKPEDADFANVGLPFGYERDGIPRLEPSAC